MLNGRIVGTGAWRYASRLLMLAAIAQGAVPVAVAQTYGTFRPLAPENYPYRTAVPPTTLPETSPVPGSPMYWGNTGAVEPFAAADPSAPVHGYKFRDMPGLPSAQDSLPKFRPDRHTGRFPSNWSREHNPWQSGFGVPPPVFRPLDDGNHAEGRSAKRGGPQSGRGEYPPVFEPRGRYGERY